MHVYLVNLSLDRIPIIFQSKLSISRTLTQKSISTLKNEIRFSFWFSDQFQWRVKNMNRILLDTLKSDILKKMLLYGTICYGDVTICFKRVKELSIVKT